MYISGTNKVLKEIAVLEWESAKISKLAYECKDQIRHFFKQIHYFVIQIRQVLLGLYIWETILIETLTKMNANSK